MWRLPAALALSAVAACAQDATGAIEGVLTDSATKLPVLGAQISITPEGTAADVFTDASGSFRFSGLAADRYGVRAKRDGYREAFRFVQVKNGGSAEQIALKMTPLSEIAGQVLDEDGHPMEGVEIYIGSSIRARTDAEGRYQFGGLVPGSYRLYCRLPSAMREKRIEHDEKSGEVRGYAGTYYFPGLEDAARAVQSNVAAGVHIGGFDFRLRHVPLVEFSGRLLDITREPLGTAAVELASEELFVPGQRRRVKPDGSFRFDLIPPGHYALAVYREGGVNMAARPYRMTVDIGPGGSQSAELRIPRNVDLAVNLIAPHPERTTGGLVVSVGSARPIEGGMIFNSATAPLCQVGKECVLRDVPPGQWIFNVQPLPLQEADEPPRKLYIESVRFGQQNAWGVPVTVAEGGNPPIEITVTDKAGAISASVSTEDGQPTDTAYIDARRADVNDWPMRRTQRSPTGQFVMDGLIPGEYTVAAFVAADDEDSIRMAPVERCGDRAVKVTVTAGQMSNVTLKPCVPQ